VGVGRRSLRRRRPAGVAAAQLNVALEGDPWQLAIGFGSIWVSGRYGQRVVRVNPDTGTVVASIDVGDRPFVALLGEPGADQSDEGTAGREGARDVAASGWRSRAAGYAAHSHCR
jgi:glutamine cyclotransferase